MTVTLRKGCYIAKEAVHSNDVARAQRLRGRCFNLGRVDLDPFDANATHILIEDARTGTLVGTYRFSIFTQYELEKHSYSGQYYGLNNISQPTDKIIEIGRFCIDPSADRADVLRVAWGALTRVVDDCAIDVMMGCSSFSGCDPTKYIAPLTLLAQRHLGPTDRAPLPKSPEIIAYAASLREASVNRREALLQMPPLLKTYLGMGGWVSDHAVVDREMHTFHVFTAVEIAKIPPARAKALRAVAVGPR